MYKRKLNTLRVRKHRMKRRCLELFEEESKREAGKDILIYVSYVVLSFLNNK